MPRPRLSLSAFVAVAQQVVAELPEEFQERLENVLIDVEREPSPRLLREQGLDPATETLLGLFQGAPLTERGLDDLALPNRILLFQRPIERACRSVEEIKYEIRRTLLHELAHHFGFSEDDLDDFESQPSPFDD